MHNIVHNSIQTHMFLEPKKADKKDVEPDPNDYQRATNTNYYSWYNFVLQWNLKIILQVGV